MLRRFCVSQENSPNAVVKPRVCTHLRLRFATAQEKNLTYVYSLCYNPNS